MWAQAAYNITSALCIVLAFYRIGGLHKRLNEIERRK